MKTLSRVTRSISRESSRDEEERPSAARSSFKSGSAKVVKLKNVTRALSRDSSDPSPATSDNENGARKRRTFKQESEKVKSVVKVTRNLSRESSDSPKRTPSSKVSFKTRSEKVRTLSGVTRKLSKEPHRGEPSPFKAKAGKVRMLSNASKSFSKEQPSSGDEKIESEFKSRARKVGMLSKTAKMLSTDSIHSKDGISSDKESERQTGARPKTSKPHHRKSSSSLSPSRTRRQERSNMSRMSSLFGSEVEIDQPASRPKSSKRSRSEEKNLGEYSDLHQVRLLWFDLVEPA